MSSVSFKHGEKILIAPKDFSLAIGKDVSLSCLDFSTSIPASFLDDSWKSITDDEIGACALAGKRFFVNIDHDGEFEIDLSCNDGAYLLCVAVKMGVTAHVIISGNHTGKAFGEIRVSTDSDSVLRVTRRHPGGELYETKKVHVGKSSEFIWKEYVHGSPYTRSHIVCDLLGLNSVVDVQCGFVCKGHEKSDVYTIARHVGKGSKSNLVAKGIVLDKSQALSRGLIRIEKSADGSDGYEKQDTLVLSEHAEADAIPNLEICNHNVTCSHGSTVGRIDEMILFYLMSRGMSRADAIKTVVSGYFSGMDELVEAAL